MKNIYLHVGAEKHTSVSVFYLFKRSYYCRFVRILQARSPALGVCVAGGEAMVVREEHKTQIARDRR